MWLLTVFLTLGNEDSRAAEASARIAFLHVDDESHLLHLVKCRDEPAEVVATLVDRERHQTRLLIKVAAANLLFALGVAQLNVRVAAGAAERLLTDSCAIAHSYADAHCVSPSHGSRLRLRGGECLNGFRLLSPRELQLHFAAAGIEPALSGFEVTHSLTTGTVVLQVSGEKQHGRHRFREPAIPFRLPYAGGREVSRACATGEVVSRQGKIVCGL